MSNAELTNEIPKYKKKKKSSTSKSKEKSKHKHEYADCLLIAKKDKMPLKATYCNVCGKIGNLGNFTTRTENGYYRILSSKEIFEQYQDLKKFYVDNIWQKYIILDKESD